MFMRLFVPAMVLMACMLVFCSSSAHAAPINYGDLYGNTVNFLQVTEDSSTDPTPLFGAPSVSGDTLDFTPTGFSATASGIGGSDTTEGTLTIIATSNPGHFIDQMQFDEAGDYTLVGFGTAATSVDVTANIEVIILDVDGVALTAPIVLNQVMAFAPSNGDFDLANDAGGGPSANSSWSGTATADLTQALIDNSVSYSGGVTAAILFYENTLTATSEDGTSAWIGKKDVSSFGITVVPEPATPGLLASALLCTLVRRR